MSNHWKFPPRRPKRWRERAWDFLLLEAIPAILIFAIIAIWFSMAYLGDPQ